MDAKDIADTLNISAADVSDRLASARRKLFEARNERTLPVDTKLLAGWNGLALAAFAEAAGLTGDARYLEAAGKIRSYIVRRLWDGSALRRAVDGRRALGSASLEDYAYVGMGLWAWAELNGEADDYLLLEQVVDAAWDGFYEGGWRMGRQSLMAEEPARDLMTDGAMPSPAAAVADVSLKLARRIDRPQLRAKALSALNSGKEQLRGNEFWYASHVGAMGSALGE